MDVFGALPEVVKLEFHDEFWLQQMDYEQIPFRCRICHEHGHLIRECPLRKMEQQKKETDRKDADGFVIPTMRGKPNRRQQQRNPRKEKLKETALNS